MNENLENKTIYKFNWKSFIISMAIVIVLVFIDQLTKQIVVNNMRLGQSITVIEDFFYITSHRNEGAAWGIGQGQLAVFIVITVIALVIYGFLYRSIDFKQLTLFSICLSLLVAGTLGNFIDRLFRSGKVVDFLDFYIFEYNYPIFNVADMCLVVGVILLIIEILFGKIGKKWSK